MVEKVPTTKIGKIQEVRGSIIVKGYDDIDTLTGKYSNVLTVTIYQFDNKKSGTKTLGLNIEIKTSDRYNNTSSSFVDYDEIPSLIKGLQYLEGITSNPSKLSNYEVSYATNGGLKITQFNSTSGTMVAIKAGKYSAKQIFMETSDVKKFKDMITKSLTKLKALK